MKIFLLVSACVLAPLYAAEDQALAAACADRRWADAVALVQAGAVLDAGNEDHYATALSEIADAWALKDPKAAAAWLLGYPDTRGRLMAMIGVARAWAAHDPRAAVEWARALPQPSVPDPWSAKSYQNSPMTAAAEEWASADPVTAVAWAEALTEPLQRDAAVTAVATGWARRDLAAAAQWSALMSITDPEWRDQAMYNLAMAMTLDGDPASRAVWLMCFPAGKTRDAEVTQTVTDWSQQDPVAAAAWCDKLPAGPLRTDAVERVATIWAEKDLPTAMAWALALPEGADRTRAAKEVASTWTRSDPTAAAA